MSASERLRQVDAEISSRLAQRNRAAEQAEGGAEKATAWIVPAPRRVPVFLRRGAGHGDFGQLTITHPVPPRPRRVPTA